MGVAVLATLVEAVGDDAVYDLVGDESEPAVRVAFHWTGEHVDVDIDAEGERRGFVRKGVAAVAGQRFDTGVWPVRLVRIS